MKRLLFILCATTLFISGCSKSETTSETKAAPSKKNVSKVESAEPKEIDPKDDVGVGPIKTMTLEDIDATVAANGKQIFQTKCSACHKMKKRYIGPQLTDVTKRRRPEWIMNMILNPERMVKENAAAKKLLMEYTAPMANQGLTEEEARAILEYFRQNDAVEKGEEK